MRFQHNLSSGQTTRIRLGLPNIPLDNKILTFSFAHLETVGLSHPLLQPRQLPVQLLPLLIGPYNVLSVPEVPRRLAHPQPRQLHQNVLEFGLPLSQRPVGHQGRDLLQIRRRQVKVGRFDRCDDFVQPPQ